MVYKIKKCNLYSGILPKNLFCNVLQSNLNSFQCSHKGMFILLIFKSLITSTIIIKILDIAILIIIYKLIPVSLPTYISPFNGDSRLRNTRMDDMSYVVNDNTVIPLDTAHSNSKFFKSFFYRTLHIWNSLPLNIRKICTLVKFKLEVKNFLWNKLLSNNSLEMG